MPHPEKHESRSPPSDWVRRFAGQVPAGGAVLDLACGGGRHGRLLLERGHPATFVDADTSALGDLIDHPLATVIKADLETGEPWPLGGQLFDGVVVTNYLWRPILSDIIGAVSPGGILIYETFAEGNEAFGRPRNPDFLLRSGELLEATRGKLTVVAYGQCLQENRRVVQHIAAVRAA
ncbi:MAG: class I SAM-dependent methyltransferase [Proteobacteria bacterium]|nr:class I SAM-dependent methyltransferase [Pseudomonadota bacterium]